jgi:hypothetical protein
MRAGLNALFGLLRSADSNSLLRDFLIPSFTLFFSPLDVEGRDVEVTELRYDLSRMA